MSKESGPPAAVAGTSSRVTADAEPRPVRRYRGVPMQARRAQRREALVRAAIEVYGERGYRNATVKAICAAAGLTERYFYESFDNPEALLVAAFRAVTTQTLKGMEEAGSGEAGGARARMAAVLRAYFETLKERPQGARVFLVEIVGVSIEIADMLDWAVQSFGELFDRTVGAESEPAPGRALLRAGVVGGVFQIALNWIGRDYEDDATLVVEQALRLTDLLQPPR